MISANSFIPIGHLVSASFQLLYNWELIEINSIFVFYSIVFIFWFIHLLKRDILEKAKSEFKLFWEDFDSIWALFWLQEINSQKQMNTFSLQIYNFIIEGKLEFTCSLYF